MSAKALYSQIFGEKIIHKIDGQEGENTKLV